MAVVLHSSKRNVERGWEEKDLGFLQGHAVIWLDVGWNKGNLLGREDFLLSETFRRESLSRWCTLKFDNR